MSLEELLESGTDPTKGDITEEELVKLFRKFRGLQKKQQRDQAFWAATNENLKIAYEKLDEKDRELARAYAIIQDDLSVASKIQGALLPKPPKKMAAELELAVHHKQLAEVGGDYYDYFNTTSGNYAIGVFDIARKDTLAAPIFNVIRHIAVLA